MKAAFCYNVYNKIPRRYLILVSPRDSITIVLMWVYKCNCTLYVLFISSGAQDLGGFHGGCARNGFLRKQGKLERMFKFLTCK